MQSAGLDQLLNRLNQRPQRDPIITAIGEPRVPGQLRIRVAHVRLTGVEANDMGQDMRNSLAVGQTVMRRQRVRRRVRRPQHAVLDRHPRQGRPQ